MLNDNEIIKAWNVVRDKGRMPTTYLINETLDLINRQKAEKQKLEVELQAMRGAANSYKAEVERLTKDSKRLKKVQMQLDDAMKMYHVIKAEAYKEFAEKLKLHSYIVSDESQTGIVNRYSVVTVNQIDNLLKELETKNNEH